MHLISFTKTIAMLIIITYYISYITELTIYNGLTITAIHSLIYKLVILHQKIYMCVLNYLKRKKKKFFGR